MRILHCISSVDPSGGGPIEGIKQLGSVLISEGHHVEVACLDKPGESHHNDFPLPLHALGPARLSYGFSPRFLPWLRQNATSYDAVVINGLWQYNGFATWLALHGTKVPYVVYTHGMLDPWFKRRYPLKHLKKWLYWTWGQYPVLRDARAVLFTSDEERLLARKSFWLYRCKEVVVNYGTAAPVGDPEAQIVEFTTRYPELAGKRLVLFMGRIHVKKGCDMLIEAFAREMRTDREFHLVMAGPDQENWVPELQRITEKMGIVDRITWAGMLKGSLKCGALNAAEVFILPSHQENFGIAVAEALSCGLPVLISNKVNIWREVKDSSAGFVAPDTLEGTRQLLCSWKKLLPTQRQTMRFAARQCFSERFEITEAAHSLLRVLEGVDGNPTAQSRASAGSV